MARTSKVTEKIFKAVKQLTAGGATIPECAEYFMLAHSTISRIRAAETWEDYKHSTTVAFLAMKEKESKKKYEKAEAKVVPTEAPVEQKQEPKQEQVVEHKQSITIQATHYMMTEMQKTNELLTQISNKLAYIVEQLS